LLLALLVLCALGFSPAAVAWGDEGHRISAYIANALLTDAAREQLQVLIGTDDLSQIANYLDEQRAELEQHTPGSSRWHYENREVCGRDAGLAQCSRGQCVTRQIEHFMRVLKDDRATVQQRADAVRVLVHLIGDLHQPLHLADNHDRGGNDIFVRLPREREPRRLHEVWDTRFIQLNLNRRAPATYARLLLHDFSGQHAQWQQGDVQQWADETYRIGKRGAYQALPGFSCGAQDSHAIELTSSYIDAARKVSDEQLAKAGMRIAWVLNESLRNIH
jgi:hypothetical protein